MIKGAVIGVGYLGKFHAQKYSSLEMVELVGVCDPSREQCDRVAGELGVTAFYDHRDLLDKVDVVTIAASTRFHYEIAKDFLNYGVHVLVEKPITSTVAEARELIEISQKKNIKLQVGHIERFNPVYKALKDLVVEPRFIDGKRLAMFKPRGADVSVAHDVMIHDIDLVLDLMGSSVKNVISSGGNFFMPTTDFVSASLEFENGGLVHLQASRMEADHCRSMRVVDRQGVWDADFSGELKRCLCQGVFEGGMLEAPLKFESLPVKKYDAMEEETRAFFQSVINDEACVVSGEDGLASLELVERVISGVF